MAFEDKKAELAKYEAEMDSVNKRLAALDEEKFKLVRHGTRLEGVAMFIKSLIAEDEKAAFAAKVAANGTQGAQG